MEFGLCESFPIYAGGLGVLAGDFLRSSAALRLPVVGIGLAWAHGYTRQQIGADGRPIDLPSALRRDVMVRQEPVISVAVAGHEVPLAIHRVDAFQNAPLYLLEPIDERDRWITERLYGGGKDDRVAQEILLGVGGVRALAALGLGIDIYHFNEGHAVFAGLELLRRHREEGLAFEVARERVRRHIVFTTHTPVDAGNEEHEPERLRRMGALLGCSMLELERLGGRPFNMTVAGLRLAGRANAVAALHGETARRMWHDVGDGAPIDAITNGVDHRVWQDARVRQAAGGASDEALEHARRACKEELLAEVERRSAVRLDPQRLTIGFARRATAYKRPTLLFHDRERARSLMASGKLQIVYAGKAHPKDQRGGDLIAELVQLGAEHPGSVVFVPDYDLALGRIMTRGCDVWLNTPRRPLEACGTSGMKAAMNGVLNVSILDGWWPEGCAPGVTGWHIGDELERSEADGDAADAAALYRLLEDEIVPTFVADRPRWCTMMRASIAMAQERFSSDRMVSDYFAQLYRAEPTRLVSVG
jgi:starch phosphorylase